MPDTMDVLVLTCARCRQDHNIVFERLTNPPDEYDWWGMCPNTHQPVWCRQGGIPPLVEVEVARLTEDDLAVEAVRLRVAKMTRQVAEESVVAVCEGDEAAAKEAQARFCDALVALFNEMLEGKHATELSELA